MVVTNPTELDLVVSVEGNVYTLPAKESISGVKESHAEYWKEHIHQFIEVSPEVKKEVKETAPKKVEEAVVAKK